MSGRLGDEAQLSGRQRELVSFAADGMTDKEIARRLGLSEGTLRTYWDRLRERLRAQSRTEIVARVFQDRLRCAEAERDQLRQIVDALPQPVWTALPCGHVDFCNHWFHQYSGIAVEACIGPGCKILMPPSQLSDSRARWRCAQANSRAYEAEVQFKCAADGSFRWHHIQLTPLFDADGAVRKWLGSGREFEPA